MKHLSVTCIKNDICGVTNNELCAAKTIYSNSKNPARIQKGKTQLAGPRRCARDLYHTPATPTPTRLNFIHFHAVFLGELFKIIVSGLYLWGWRPLWKIMDLPLNW